MSNAFEWLGDYAEHMTLHPEAYAVVAFADVVGVVCSTDCGNKAVADIESDHGDEADAGLDVATHEQVRNNRHCMGCGKEVL